MSNPTSFEDILATIKEAVHVDDKLDQDMDKIKAIAVDCLETIKDKAASHWNPDTFTYLLTSKAKADSPTLTGPVMAIAMKYAVVHVRLKERCSTIKHWISVSLADSDNKNKLELGKLADAVVRDAEVFKIRLAAKVLQLFIAPESGPTAE